MSSIRSSLARQARMARQVYQQPRAFGVRRTFASQQEPPPPPQPPSSTKGLGSIPIALGAVCIIVPGSLYLLSSGHEDIQHNDHRAQKEIHTPHTVVEDSKYPAGRIGGKLHGIDQVVTTKHEDVESDLPHDAPNHPVNREKIEKTMQLKPATKRTDPMKSL